MKCLICGKKSEGKNNCLHCQKVIDECKNSDKKYKISELSEKFGISKLTIYEILSNAMEDKILPGKIEDGHYLSNVYLKELYLDKLKDFNLEHTDILDEELNRQKRAREFVSKTENKEKKTD